MIILDTNVLSALMHRIPEPVLVAWLDGQPRLSVWTTSVTVLEVRFGLELLPTSRRRLQLQRAFARLIDEAIEGRVLAFDFGAAEHSATLMAARQKAGRAGDLRDTMIAGIALAHRARVATRNTRDFTDLSIEVVNPWQK
jgi:toxin FitB